MKSLVQENRDLKQELEVYKNKYEKLKKEFDFELAKLCEPFNNSLKMRDDINKMKCCANCKNCMYLDGCGYKCGLEEASLFDVREIAEWCKNNWESKD